MARIAVVGTKGGWSSEKLADVVAETTGERILIEMEKVRLDLEKGAAWFGNENLANLDAIIIKKIGTKYSPDLLDRLEMLRYLNEQGLRMFSKPLSIIRVLDRLSCTITLKAGCIPIPPTTITEDVGEAIRVVEEYGEAVFKPLYTTKARGMKLIESGPETKTQIEEFKLDNPIMYIQKRIELNGRDLGVAFMGGKYLTTYARLKKAGSWTTTTHFGGKYERYEPSKEVLDIAQKAQALFGLDFTSVDVVLTDEGPMVFEVSAFGGFRGITETSDIDPSARYLDYVLKRVAK